MRSVLTDISGLNDYEKLLIDLIYQMLLISISRNMTDLPVRVTIEWASLPQTSEGTRSRGYYKQ